MKTLESEKILLNEKFTEGMENWWVEGGVRTWIENGRLYVDADPEHEGDGYGVATVWYKQELPADVRIEFDAHVISSSNKANNINFFFNYSDPSGKSLYETRATRADAAYAHYHQLNGYILTFLNDFRAENGLRPDGKTSARIRFRRCPGFNLIDETFSGTCEVGITYQCVIVKRGGHLSFSVNGEEILSVQDPEPLGPGLIGLRTFRTVLWWDNIKVTEL